MKGEGGTQKDEGTSASAGSPHAGKSKEARGQCPGTLPAGGELKALLHGRLSAVNHHTCLSFPVSQSELDLNPPQLISAIEAKPQI